MTPREQAVLTAAHRVNESVRSMGGPDDRLFLEAGPLEDLATALDELKEEQEQAPMGRGGGEQFERTAPVTVQCPVCGAMVDDATLVTGVWEGEPHCNCPPLPRCPHGLQYTGTFNEWCEECCKSIEDTAPDDPVCATCNLPKSTHDAAGASQLFRPASPPAELVLDPVRVEAAAKATWEARGFGSWNRVEAGMRARWIGDAEVAIRAYLTGGAS